MAGKTGGTEDVALGVDKSGRSEYGISGILLGNKLGKGHCVNLGTWTVTKRRKKELT